MTEGQNLAIEQLQSIEKYSPESIEVLETKVTTSGSVELCWVKVSIRLGVLEKKADGLLPRTREQIWIGIHPDFPFSAPKIQVPHKRFAGFHHVQWMRTLCLYQAPTIEWDSSDGIYGLLERLFSWFEAAARNELDPIGAPLHPPVAYSSSDAPTIVPTKDTPVVESNTWFGWVELKNKSHHIQLGQWYQMDQWSQISSKVGAAILFAKEFPFEYPSTVSDLVDLIEQCGLAKDALALIFEGAALRSDKGEPVFVVIGTPMRGVRGADRKTQHLAIWMIDSVGADALRIACEKFSDIEKLKEIGKEAEDLFFKWCNIGVKTKWCSVRENRPEAVESRDRNTSLSIFKNKSVSLWGCGALGSHFAEMLVRAGVKQLILRDYGRVAPGLLCRQLFEVDDVGRGKAIALRERLLKINPEIDISAYGKDLLSDPLDSDDILDDVDIIIDTSANQTLLSKLERRIIDLSPIRPALASAALSHDARTCIYTLCQSEYGAGPHDAQRRAKLDICRNPTLQSFADIFWPVDDGISRLFQPEPGCSDPTFTGSSSDLMTLSGVLLNKLAYAFANVNSTKCCVGIFDYASAEWDQPKQYSKEFPTWQTVRDPQFGYDIRIDPNTLVEVRAWINKNSRENSDQIETGGLLFGEWDESIKVCWINEVSGPPSDSFHSNDGFISGVKDCDLINEEKKKRSRGSVRYIGNWHTHPVSEALPSAIDLSGMFKILDTQQDTPSKALLLIIGNAVNNPHLGAHIFSRDEFSQLLSQRVYRRTFSLSPLNFRDANNEVGLTLSGGGLRAVAFHLGCLRALHHRGVLQQVKAISSVSGGSIIAAMYAYSSDSFEDFDKRVVNLLQKGLLKQILKQIVKPTTLVKSFWSFVAIQTPAALRTVFKKGIEVTKQDIPDKDWNNGQIVFTARVWSLIEALRNQLFGNISLLADRRNDTRMVFNATELRTGTAFRFGNKESGCWRYGRLFDNDIELAKVVAASALYPLAFPSLDEYFTFVDRNGKQNNKRVILTDGGIYDNLGVSCFDPNKKPEISLNVYNPEYLIVCDAGRGTFSGINTPTWFIPRIAQSFNSVFRKAHDSTITRLFDFTDKQLLRGFILSYLGQNDTRLPYQPTDLVRLDEVKSYPTDFSAMKPQMIEKLSMRGEQLTRMLIDHYLPDI